MKENLIHQQKEKKQIENAIKAQVEALEENKKITCNTEESLITI